MYVYRKGACGPILTLWTDLLYLAMNPLYYQMLLDGDHPRRVGYAQASDTINLESSALLAFAHPALPCIVACRVVLVLPMPRYA